MAVLDLVSEVATDPPVLLVVDDAHWLDHPTADVLAFVARRIESDPVVLLAAARDRYPAGLADAGLPEHRLMGLDDANAAALLDAADPGLPLTTRSRGEILQASSAVAWACVDLDALPHPAAVSPTSMPATDPLAQRPRSATSTG